MKRKTIKILGFLALFGIAIVAMLYALSDSITHKHNNFVRLFPPHPVTERAVLDVKYNSYYIAGMTKNHIYFGNITAPFHLLIMNTLSADTQHVHLSVSDIVKPKLGFLKVKIDSPFFYIMDGTSPSLFRGIINNAKHAENHWVARRFMYDSIFFTDGVPIGRSSFVLRTTHFLNKNKEDALGKESAYPPHFKLAPTLLEKQIDGIFCVDGMLHYNRELKTLVYVYYYRNQYIVIDTNMNLLYRSHTIDTISKAKIKVATVSSKNARTLAAPPLTVNKHSCVFENFLFIQSNLMAKNEEKKVFDMASVIDVYSLKDKSYQFSFYIFNYNRQKLRGFKIVGDKLVAQFGQYVITYDLNPGNFNSTM
jgi:hypothetical protein